MPVGIRTKTETKNQNKTLKPFQESWKPLPKTITKISLENAIILKPKPFYQTEKTETKKN